MKASELRSMTREELENLLEELRDEEFKLRVRRSTEELPNPLRLRMIRRDIARIMTILREDELGIIKLPKRTEKKKEVKAEGKEEKKTVKKRSKKKEETGELKKTTKGKVVKKTARKKKGA